MWVIYSALIFYIGGFSHCRRDKVGGRRTGANSDNNIYMHATCMQFKLFYLCKSFCNSIHYLTCCIYTILQFSCSRKKEHNVLVTDHYDRKKLNINEIKPAKNLR